ncbi:hypothetical protein L4C36_14345 [Photobacterium japonica]|uniref:DUF805 domain-containing protein n=1 Tax=Photobacterium japonica TaxID=2910235 RepID=UPI003D0A15DE
MNKYKILERDSVRVAIDISQPHSNLEISQLAAQGFRVVSEGVDAPTPERAVEYFSLSFGREIISLSLYNLLFFRTNALRRLPYLGISLIAGTVFVAIVVGLAMSLEGSMDGGSSLGMLIILALLGLWGTVSLSVARWKNIGHQGWYYLIAVIIATIIDGILIELGVEIGIAGLILALYLLFTPENYARRNMPSGGSSGNGNTNDKTPQQFNA